MGTNLKTVHLSAVSRLKIFNDLADEKCVLDSQMKVTAAQFITIHDFEGLTSLRSEHFMD